MYFGNIYKVFLIWRMYVGYDVMCGIWCGDPVSDWEGIFYSYIFKKLGDKSLIIFNVLSGFFSFR